MAEGKTSGASIAGSAVRPELGAINALKVVGKSNFGAWVIVVLVDLEVNTIKVALKGEIGVVRKSKKEVVRGVTRVEDRDTSHVTKNVQFVERFVQGVGKQTIGLIAAG